MVANTWVYQLGKPSQLQHCLACPRRLHQGEQASSFFSSFLVEAVGFVTTIVTKLGIAKTSCSLLLFWHWKATNGVHVPITIKALMGSATVGVGRNLAAVAAAANDFRHCRLLLLYFD
jgi:hypothetical protein